MFRKRVSWVSVCPDFTEPTARQDFQRADKGYDEGEATASLFVVNGAEPYAPELATTDVDQSMTDVGLTMCLVIPSSLGESPRASPTS
jgi:hypothetical protein